MSFESMMAELRKEYVESLNDKVSECQSYLDKSDFGALQNLFHKLKGSGATYGIPEASLLGELIELYMKKLNLEHTPQAACDPKVQSHLRAGTEMLKRIRDARKTEKAYAVEKDPLYLLLLPEVNPSARVSSHGSE